MYDPTITDAIFDAKEYPPTDEQRALVDKIGQTFYASRSGRKVIVCPAVAGAGKTATMLDVYKVLTFDLAGQFIQYVAFNVKAKDELIARGVDAKHAKTLNGLGHANLSRYARNHGLQVKLFDGKVIQVLRRTDEELAEIAPARRFAKSLIGFVKAHALKKFDRETLEGLADHYEVFIDLTYEECEDRYNISLDELESRTYDWIARAMVENNRVPTNGDWTIDYNDQVYLPVVLGIKCFQNDMIVVDEAQDLSLANKFLVSACLKKNGVLVLVGDDYQCIYAWRGCEVDGLSKTLARTNIDVESSPLTYNWRSGKQIIEFAQTICPSIQCGNGKEAKVETQKVEDFDVLKLEGDVAVLSRLRAPLVSYAIECLKADKPFTFQFSLKFLIDTIKQIADTNLSIRAFKRHLAQYVATKRELYVQQDADQALEDLEDFEAIMDTLLDKVRTTDKVGDLCLYIGQLDRRIKEADGSLCLSTMHGSKGLEWDTTYLLGYDKIGNRATKDWKITEARNLRFVATTRAKSHLVFIDEGQAA